jgi:acetyl esterase/lipase
VFLDLSGWRASLRSRDHPAHRQAFVFSLRLLLLAGIGFSAGCAAYGPSRGGEKVYRNVRFASPQGQDLKMDLYVPKSAGPLPVVLWIFGGSWRIGSKGYHVNVRDLPRYGIAVAAIQYRLSGTAKYPAQLEDCQEALRWLQAHGTAFGLDPERIGVSGESAGGHLAALLGTKEGRRRIRAVCAIYPATDLVSLGRQYAGPEEPSDIERLLGGEIEQKLALAADASPVNHVRTSSPPFLMFHGDRDTGFCSITGRSLRSRAFSRPTLTAQVRIRSNQLS